MKIEPTIWIMDGSACKDRDGQCRFLLQGDYCLLFQDTTQSGHKKCEICRNEAVKANP